MTKKEQKFMDLVRRVHGLLDNPDIEKKRQSQEYIGTILGSTKDIEYQEFEIEDVPAEWVMVKRPHMKKYIILYCHGGGYTTGSCKYARTITSKLASSTSMDVLGFDYHLAPEYPYPAALEDALKVWDYLMHLGYGAREIIVAGDSAGGNLALALVLRLKAEGRFLPRGLVLFSPWTDLTCSGKSFQGRAGKEMVLSQEYIYQIRDAYAGGKDFSEPLISPLFGDFKGFPPTYIQVGENEILYSDAKRLYQRMVADDVSAHMEEYERMWHVFQMAPFKTAYEAMDECAEFIFRICR